MKMAITTNEEGVAMCQCHDTYDPVEWPQSKKSRPGVLTQCHDLVEPAQPPPAATEPTTESPETRQLASV
jgi:hypothetical protein